MNKRKIGEELLRFVDGTEKQVEIHAIGNYHIGQERKKYTQTIFDKKGGFKKVEFDDAEFYIGVAKLSMGVQVTKDELKEVDNIDWKDFYDEYFKISKEKKPKSLDMSTLKQDSE